MAAVLRGLDHCTALYCRAFIVQSVLGALLTIRTKEYGALNIFCCVFAPKCKQLPLVTVEPACMNYSGLRIGPDGDHFYNNVEVSF